LSVLARQTTGAPESQPRVHPIIADIRFPDRLRAVFEQYRPEIVFHAAAHKHVPLMEVNPTEAITNNVLGTRNLLDAAAVTGVERFVMISTDKAVRPKSVMGASKRVAELLVHQTAWEVDKPYVAVRFGNVLGSRGSVLHTFKQQIADGGPITITHPDMKRYFMTIPEAVQLVLQAAVLGQGGEVFMLDMGEPVKIVELAQDLIELSGLEVGRDIEITFTGIRPGEKLHEELFIPGESYRRTEHQKIFVIESATGSVLPSQLNQVVARLEDAAYTHNLEELTDSLYHLLPDFKPLADHETLDAMQDEAGAPTGAPTGAPVVGLSASETEPVKVSARPS
jgi:FlaA1/EpsC-like NDP-sugar epimerase